MVGRLGSAGQASTRPWLTLGSAWMAAGEVAAEAEAGR